jgi:lysine/ornithine N-monooxygenase
MVLDKIEKLLEKYDNGETTLQEEQQLKNYFSQETVATHLEVYKPMFTYFLQTQNEQFTKTIPLELKKTYTLYKWISVAAIAILMVAVYFQVSNQPVSLDDLSSDELMAYNQTVEAFNLLSSKFNKGTESIDALALMSNSLEKGTENMSYLGEFSEVQNKIFKTEKNK